MRTLSSRLVATAVLLVAVVSILIATVATLILGHQLNRRLDQQVSSTLQREQGRPDGGFFPRPSDDGTAAGGAAADGCSFGGGPVGQAVRTLTVRIEDGEADGEVLVSAADGCVRPRAVSTAVVDEVSAVPLDGELHTVDLTALGSYRLAAVRNDDGEVVIAGLPTADVDDTVSNLVWWEALLIVAGLGVAAGAGRVLVRRQLAPLREVAATAHEVAALPLDSGEVDLSPRVPAPDEQTEVGQVGAALNTLLAHVESSLTARHRSEQQVRQFVADASHELRTPLSTIRGYAELSRRTPDDAAALSSSLRKVSSEADRMTRLVDDLLLLARLDAGRPLAAQPVDVTRLLLEAVADARVLGPGHRWRLELPDEPVEVLGDEQRLHQVVTNLLNNARRHTPAGSTVTVSARVDDGRAEVAVTDDGPGFPPALAEHAFERFTRGDVARTRAHADARDGLAADPGGAGLGLSIVAAIVRAHGGDVGLVSRPGETRITVGLPASSLQPALISAE